VPPPPVDEAPSWHDATECVAKRPGRDLEWVAPELKLEEEDVVRGELATYK
jgi:hypothetical protein